MSLTSEMSRLTTEFETAQGKRRATIAKIGQDVTRERHGNKTSLRRTMAAHRVATKNSLHDIFGMAALTRGAAVDMIERFGDEREESTCDLLEQLASYAADLREAVGEELQNLTATRLKTARREDSVRRAQLKDLRKRVAALLNDFSQDRQEAGEVLEHHLRTALRKKRAVAHKALKAAAKPLKRTARKTTKTTKKRKHARS
jgi:hypothetical protein